MNRLLRVFFGSKAGLLYLLIFAVAIGSATFIENDFGTSTAQAVVYQGAWFEMLLLLFACSIVYNVITYRLIQRKQYATTIFHLSILVILLGSAVTRKFGWEGMLHIREGGQNNVVISRDSYLKVEMARGDEHYTGENLVFTSSFGEGTDINEKFSSPLGTYSVRCIKTLVEPHCVLTSDSGDGAIKVVFGGVNGRRELPLTGQNPIDFEGVRIHLDNKSDAPSMDKPFVIRLVGDELEIASVYPMYRRIMATGQEDTLVDGMWHPLVFRALHSSMVGQFVFSDFEPEGNFYWESSTKKITATSSVGLLLEVRNQNGFVDTIFVSGTQGVVGEPTIFQDDEVNLAISLGSTSRVLPFSIALDNFQMTRYPGTDAAATFASDVRVIDDQLDSELNYNIHMNHILDYKGYRFFQSSYDQDERGSYLSVNHDFYGTWITYVGYFLLTLGMVWVLFAPKTRFSLLRKRARSVGVGVMFILISVSQTVQAQSSLSSIRIVDAEHAEKVSMLFVQDHRGRMKPMHTLSREVLRKVSGKEHILGLNADQFILSSALSPADWYAVPIIQQGQSPVVNEVLGTTEKLVSYAQCFDAQGNYLLRDAVQSAQSKKPTEKNANDKTIIALDERVNIMNMVFSGQFFKWVPIEGDANNTWTAPSSHGQQSNINATNFFSVYFGALDHAIEVGHYEEADAYLAQLKEYQQDVAQDILPSPLQAKLEILMNSYRPFDRLAVFYGVLALAFLALLLIEVWFGTQPIVGRSRTIMLLVAYVPFILHTLALCVRWYISERAPWSNGYESLIYIGWTSALSGLLLSRREFGAMAATYILSAIILLIAMLSYLNPEITPLVPVLKSYWLTIHVSLEAGSYGFLMLGAIIGVLILLLYILRTRSNSERIQIKIDRLQAISEMTITSGLFMLSIGTYLGGIWANESWGRYWGWDAKETWALVSILIYAIVLHLRFIPTLNNAYVFSVGTLFGLASVVMTYFGVNYYLSGLHSYAAGDPIPIPSWVYYTSISLTLLAFFAYFRKRNLERDITVQT